MKLNLTISDTVSNDSYHQVIIVDDWAAAKTRAEQAARLWASAHHGVDVDDVETHLTPTDSELK